jgi:hypothetical protein
VTFGFVDREECSVEFVWARDSVLYRDLLSSEFVWAPSRPLPFCCPYALPSPIRTRPSHISIR